MSYIFSQALVAEFSGGKSWDTEPSVQLSGSPTPNLSLWHDKTMELSRLSRFGMTCNLLTESLGADVLTWWLAGFPVKTSALPEKAQESLESDLGCGPTWRASLAKFDPDSCSWKTVQLSLLGDSELSSVIWPRSGMTADGQCWELPMLGRRTRGIGCGYWQTPLADDSVSRAKGKISSRGKPGLSAQVLLTTPSASDATRGGKITDKMTGTSLVQQINTPAKWPTPCANSHTGVGSGPNKTGAPNLQTVVQSRTWPTATAYKGWSPNHNRADTDDRLDYSVERQAFTPGQTTPPMRLNPNWVEWLMGWPIGHTDLKP